MKTYYGLIDIDDIKRTVKSVCDTVGHGDNNTAVDLILGTIAQETLYGTLLDNSAYGAGVGLCQCDPISFYDVQERTRGTAKRAIIDRYGVNIDSIHHRELAYSPLLSIIWCRLHYRLIPEKIGVTVYDHAAYWKKYYNTSAGRGTVEKYIESYNRYIGL